MIFKHACLLAILAVTTGLVASSSAADPKATEAGSIRVYVGTYTWGGSKGIYRTELDLATGRLSPAEVAAEATNPSFLVIHPNRKFCVCDRRDWRFSGPEDRGRLGVFHRRDERQSRHS